MAKNWTIAEAIEAYMNNDKNAIMDIGKRFPLLADLVSRVVSGDKEATVKLFGMLPEYNTLYRLNGKVKDAEDAEDTEDEVEEADEKPAKTVKNSKKAESEEEEDDADEDDGEIDYEKMTGRQIYKLGRERGIKFEDTKKAAMIEVMKEWDKKHASNAADDEEEDEADYEDMTPQELYKECKKRGIKTEPKQKAATYIKLLKQDDAEASEAEEDDDWGDDEEDEKPAKKADKKADKTAKPSKPSKPAKEEDEDDEWDL